jgi:hypothetical protein
VPTYSDVVQVHHPHGIFLAWRGAEQPTVCFSKRVAAPCYERMGGFFPGTGHLCIAHGSASTPCPEGTVRTLSRCNVIARHHACAHTALPGREVVYRERANGIADEGREIEPHPTAVRKRPGFDAYITSTPGQGGVSDARAFNFQSLRVAGGKKREIGPQHGTGGSEPLAGTRRAGNDMPVRFSMGMAWGSDLEA